MDNTAGQGGNRFGRSDINPPNVTRPGWPLLKPRKMNPCGSGRHVDDEFSSSERDHDKKPVRGLFPFTIAEVARVYLFGTPARAIPNRRSPSMELSRPHYAGCSGANRRFVASNLLANISQSSNLNLLSDASEPIDARESSLPCPCLCPRRRFGPSTPIVVAATLVSKPLPEGHSSPHKTAYPPRHLASSEPRHFDGS